MVVGLRHVDDRMRSSSYEGFRAPRRIDWPCEARRKRVKPSCSQRRTRIALPSHPGDSLMVPSGVKACHSQPSPSLHLLRISPIYVTNLLDSQTPTWLCLTCSLLPMPRQQNHLKRGHFRHGRLQPNYVTTADHSGPTPSQHSLLRGSIWYLPPRSAHVEPADTSPEGASGLPPEKAFDHPVLVVSSRQGEDDVAILIVRGISMTPDPENASAADSPLDRSRLFGARALRFGMLVLRSVVTTCQSTRPSPILTLESCFR